MADAYALVWIVTLAGVVPVAVILQRIGRSPWWALLFAVPVVNVIGLWMLAFARWPKLDRKNDQLLADVTTAFRRWQRSSRA
jgi:uncharacterized membrane protein YhaH (DUF805 family)